MSPGNPETSAKAYRAAMSRLAESMCAPFWWSIAEEAGTTARILNNGTICYLDTGTRKIGVSANHVYRRYLDHVAQHGSAAIECQLGGSTIYPERSLIEQSEKWDIATFEIHEVFVGASARNPKTHHRAPKWPPERVRQSDGVLYGRVSRYLARGKRLNRGPAISMGCRARRRYRSREHRLGARIRDYAMARE